VGARAVKRSLRWFVKSYLSRRDCCRIMGMDNTALLKEARNLLLQLHKMLVDFEREGYEMINGRQSSGQFLNLLLEDPGFVWLKEFSNLIVVIDEMFAQKDGYDKTAVDAELSRMRDLADMKDVDDNFRARYQYALQESSEIAAKHAELKTLIAEM
jgi:hypothetical protein